MTTAIYNKIGDVSIQFDHINDPMYELNDTRFGWSKNEIRDAVCEALNRAGRNFRTQEPIHIQNAYGYLSGKELFYIPTIKGAHSHNEQVWEGLTITELINEIKRLFPLVWNEYRLCCVGYNTEDIGYILDKLSRMDAVKAAAFCLRKLSYFKLRNYN